MDQFKKLITAPVFKDSERTRIAAWLNAILLAVLGSAIALPLVIAILDPGPRPTIQLMTGATALVSAGMLFLLRRGHIRTVGLLLSLALWSVFTVAIYTYDGIRDVAISAYFFVIILISLTHQRGTVFAFSLASLLAVTGAFFAERSGVITVSFDPVPDPLDLIVIVLSLSLSTTLLRLAIKSQKAAHQALRQEHDRAQQYLEVASVMLVALNEQGQITLINRKGCQILDYREEELLGQDWFQTCLPARNRDEVRQRFDSLVRGEIAPTEIYEHPVLTRSGEERVIRWHNSLLRDETGQIVGTLSSGQDITERLRAQEAQRESELRYRAVAEAAIAGIGIADADESLTYVNPAFARMIGYTPDEMQGMNLAHLTLTEEFERFTQLTTQREKGITNTYETRLRHKDGRILNMLVSASPLFSAGGTFEGTLAVVVNITEQVQASQELEERKTYLEGVLEAAPDAIVTLTPEQRVVEWNTGAENLFGYTAQEAVGCNLDDLVAVPEIRQEAQELHQISLSGQQVGPLETVRHHKDGSPIDVTISGGPITVGGRLIGHVAVYTDITARKRAERALQESQERLLAVLEGIDAHIYVADMETYEILFMNRPMRQDFGEGLEGQICWQVLRGGTERCPHCSNEKLLDVDGKPTGVHVWEGQNPLTGRWYANYDRAIRWIDDRMVRLQIAFDITARKRAERELEERRVYLEGVLNAAPDAIVTLNAEHRIVEWNPGAESLFRYTAAEAVGRNLDDLVNDPETIGEAVDLTKEVLNQNPVGPIETVRYRKDGSPVDVMLAGAPIVVGDELIGAVGIYTDITERKRAEKALQTTLERKDALYEIAQALIAPESLTELLQNVPEIIAQVLPADRTTLIVLDQQGQGIAHFVRGGSGAEAISRVSQDELKQGLTGWALREREPVLSPKGEPDPRESPAVQQRRIETHCGAIIVAPLLFRDRALGTLTAINRLDQRNFSRRDLDLMTAIAQQVATAIENTRLHEELQQRAAELARSKGFIEALSHVGAQIEATHDLAEIFNMLGSELKQRGIDCFVTSLSPQDGALILEYVSFGSSLQITIEKLLHIKLRGYRLSRERFPTFQQVAERKQAVFEPDTERLLTAALPRTAKGILGKLAQAIDLGQSAAIQLPLIVEGEVVGILGMWSPDLQESDVPAATVFASQVAAAIENAQLIEGLEETVAARTAEIEAERDNTAKILHSVGDAIAVSSPDLKIEYVNDAFTTLTGYTKEEAKGQPSNFILAEALPEPTWRALQKAMAHGDVWRGEAIFRRKDGRTYEAAVTIAPLLDAEDQLAGYISSHHDISRLKDLARAKNQFITNISHELRTPAANIKLYIHLMQKDESTEKSERHAQVVYEQAERLENLVEDVLEMTELDSSPIIDEWETLDLPSLVTSRAIHYHSQAQKVDLTLEVTPFPPQIPLVKGDQRRLIQALDKLIENALIFTPEGGRVTLEVGSARTPEATWATIAVRDTGPGISPEEQARVFERFFRGSLADSGHIPGTGLGLSVAQAIMQAHGGRITVESEPAPGTEPSDSAQSSDSKGSTFTLWLRAQRSASDETRQPL